jgi:hypothetical protein
LGGVILRTTNGGSTWNAQVTPTSQTLNSIFFVNDSVGYAAGASGVILKTRTGGTTSSEIEATGPVQFLLHQNYPNPFNPSTKIKFSIPVGTGYAPSVLKVYDMLGREVATLVNENLPPGSYEVTFSAEGGSASGGDAAGLASGVYVYRLTSGNFTQTRRMMLVR